MEKQNRIWNMIGAAAIILGMIGAAVLFQDREIIFPEIAALCTGVFLAPKLPWKDTGLGKFLGLMTLSACLGIFLPTVIPLLWLRVVVGCAFALVCLTLTGSGLWPMLSACILPALMNVTTPVYLFSVAGCSLAIVLVKQVMGGFQQVRSDTDYRSWMVLRPRITGILWLLAYALIPCALGLTPLIAPPLFVLFLELYTENDKQRGREWQICLLGICCCTSGALLTLLLQHQLGGGPLLAGLVITPVVFALLKGFRLYLPPVSALCYLPLILPAEKLMTYPLFTGITLLVMTVFLRYRRSHCGNPAGH